ncbi:DUF4097 family beta strand repeat-containing protein [Fredinandcohnia sp. 179-A 10B2 NHS]|uniref:DUF4097 family beta strand repeat-containing protein n=1 Tax=Fredinandcohnia sp. 179-A 10B2 NHS TaxID=3235176 RepID=UPI0039A22FCE
MKKIMYGALLLVMVGVLGLIISVNTSGVEVFTFSSVEVDEKQEVPAEGVKKIVIDSPSVDVNVTPGNGDEIYVEFTGKVGKKSKALYNLDINEDGDTVEITMEKENKFQFMMFNFTKVSLNVEVPEKVYEELQINAASGDIVVDEVNAQELTIETHSGDIDVKNGEGIGKLVVKASSGDVLVNDVFVENKLEIKTSSGDIVATDNQAKVIELLASSGDISTTNLNSKEVTINTSSGDIEVEAVEVTGDLILEASSGDIDVEFLKTPASLAVDFRGGSGDGDANIEGMEFSEKTEHRIIGEIGSGEYKLNVRTSSGDFTVN